jgi:hypothetical protein
MMAEAGALNYRCTTAFATWITTIAYRSWISPITQLPLGWSSHLITRIGWTDATLYEVSVQSSVRNVCGQPQQGSVVTTFSTESLILATAEPTIDRRPQSTPTKVWLIIPVLPIHSTSTPTPVFIQPTPSFIPTQTLTALRTKQPPIIATPTATQTPLPVSPPPARVTDKPRPSPNPLSHRIPLP